MFDVPDNWLVFSVIYPDSPAKKAGVPRGALLLSITGQPTATMKPSDAAKLLQRSADTTQHWDITILPANHSLLSANQVSHGARLLSLIRLPLSGNVSVAAAQATGCFHERDKVLEIGYM